METTLKEIMYLMKGNEMITERTLRNWRSEAIETINTMEDIRAKQVKEDPDYPMLLISTMADRIKRLTIELMDIMLIEKIQRRSK
jgi:hypothetical protein